MNRRTRTTVAILERLMPTPGERVGVVCGPGEFPADRAGTVLTVYKDRWGQHAVVRMDTGETMTFEGLNRGPGIGWHRIAKA